MLPLMILKNNTRNFTENKNSEEHLDGKSDAGTGWLHYPKALFHESSSILTVTFLLLLSQTSEADHQ